jgi:hypothetical protein
VKMLDALKKANLALLALLYPLIQTYRNLTWRTSGETFFLLSFDIDYRKEEETLPQLVSLLRKHDIRASFACVGRHVEDRPEPYRLLVGEGHELVNHSHTHPHNKELSPDRRWADLSTRDRKLEIERSQDVFEKKVGVLPIGFRLPHFGNIQKDTDDAYYGLLTECGFAYSSSVLDFRLNGKPWVKMEPSGIIEIGITTCPFHPYTAMDSYHIMRSRRLIYRLIHSRIGVLHTLARAADLSQRRRLPINVYLDPLDMDPKLLGPILKDVQMHGIRFMRYADFIRDL